MIFIISCSQQEEGLFAENVAAIPDNKKEYAGVIDYFTDLGTLNINAMDSI